MSRIVLRLLMALVGVTVFVLYALAAGLVYLLLVTVWANRPPLGTTLLLLAVMTLLFGFLSYQFGTTRLLRSLDTRELPREAAPGLHRRVDRLAERMAVERPGLLVGRMALPNALALGSARRGVVVVDRSLFRLLSLDELGGIVAHELAHLESRDSLVQTLAYSAMRTVVGLFMVLVAPVLIFAAGVARAVAWLRGRPTRPSETTLGRVQRSVYTGVAVVFVVLTLLVRAHSRRREFAADDRAAEVTGRPLALARALAKIERVSDPDWGLLSPLYVRGDEEGTLGRLFSTHPTTDDRIDRLVERHRERRPRH